MSITPNIPSLSSKVPSEIRKAFDSLRGWFKQVETQGGFTSSGTGGTGGGGNTIIINPVTPGTDDDVPTMPQPTGFTVTGGFNSILLQWDEIVSEYFAYMEIWRSTTDNIGTAVLIGMAPGVMFTDVPPDASLSVTYYYWIRAVNTAGVAGPYNATAGTAGSTADDPEYVLEVLTGEITDSELATALSTRISDAEADIAEEKVIRTAALAPDYSATATYALEETVHYSGKIYRCTTAIAAPEAWNAAHWTEVTIPLYAQYTLRLAANGYVGGFGMSNDGTEVAFGIVADKFWIVRPTAPAYSSGSTYKLNDRVTYNNKQYKCTTAIAVPESWNASHWTDQLALFVVDGDKGVVMDTAYIKEATITSAMLENVNTDKLVVTGSGTIASAIIGTGHITNAMIADVIQSTNFLTGVSGWKINKAGDCEFNGGVFRGQVIFTSNSSGYNNLSDRPDSLADINATESNKLTNLDSLSMAPTGCTVSGGKITKNSGLSSSWNNAHCYSADAFTGGCFVSFRPSQNNLWFMAGLNSDPDDYVDYTDLDYAWYPKGDGVLTIYEGGANRGNFGAYTSSTVLSIKYDGVNVFYAINGVVVRTVAVGTVQTFSFHAAFHSPLAALDHLQFGPSGVHLNSWAKPDYTLIDGNKIYTGDAYVDTLQIKGNAVTVPVAANQVGSVSQAGINTWTTVLSGSIDVGGGGLEILFTGTSSMSANAPAHNNGTYSGEQYIGIFINGVLAKEYQVNAASVTGDGGFDGVTNTVTLPATVGYFLASPPTGTLSVLIRVRGTVVSYRVSGTVTGGHVLLLGVKR